MGIYTDRQWEKAGVAARARSNRARKPVQKAVAKATKEGLVGVRFASSRAYEVAREHKLAWPTFEARVPSSTRGFTVCDVRAVLEGG